MKKFVALSLLCAVLILVLVVRVLPRLAQRRPESQEHHGLLGEWTLSPAPTGMNGTARSAHLPARTILGFGEGGREVIVAWVVRPHHKRPTPISQVGAYRLQGPMLVQTAPPHSDAFSGLGLAVSPSPTGPMLTSRFEIRNNRLILSQPETGKSVSLQLTANALPPTGPAGGPGRH